MNIHGYKRKKKEISRLIKEEESKEEPNVLKLDRLLAARGRITRQIKHMKKVRKK